MNVWANILGYQAMWLVAIWGAGHGLWWPGPLAALPFMAWVLLRHGAATDLKLMVFVVPLGFAMDTLMAATGLLHYGAPVPSANLAPVWIVTIWCCFALTLRHAFRFLIGRPVLAGLFGALGAPLAYLGAARGWDAVTFGHGILPALLVLGVMWALAMPLMLHRAARLEHLPPQLGKAHV